MAITLSTINVRSVKSRGLGGVVATHIIWSGSNENKNDGVAILIKNPLVTVKGSTVGLCRDFKLQDCFKTMHPREEGFTWFSGSGLWKLNCSLLKDADVVRQYREQYKEWQTLQDLHETRAHWWEMVKSRTMTFFRRVGKRKNKKRVAACWDCRKGYNEGLIHPDQACAIPGRKITDSLVLIRDTICYARDRNIRLVVLNLDFEKAFDRVSHQYLFEVLRKVGLPERFIEWVGLLYRGISSKFIVNGHLTKAVPINCGVRQGCPLSALLYVLCIEPLAQILRRDQRIRGTLDLTDWFGLASGSKLNRAKTQAQFYGPWTPDETVGLPLTVTQGQKVLGIRPVILSLERAIFNFFWGSKWERVRREVLKKPKDKGGKGVPDLPLFLGARYTALHIALSRGPSGNPKTTAFTRFWMGSFLRRKKILPIDLKVPVSFNLPKFYAFIPTFLKHFNLEQEEVQVLTNHRFLISCVQEREPVSPVRGLAIGEPSTVWRNVNHPALPNRLRDLSWMVAHEVLPVRSVMHSRGLSRIQTCPRPGCGAPESVRHLLWECSAAVDQWATAGSLQFPYLPAGEVLTAQLMLYGVGLSPQTQRKGFARIWLTLAAIKDAMWTSRNLLVGRHMQIPPVAVIRKQQLQSERL
ncbi:hypothetical protein WMY93_022206 [Mugilogobius chulae]|uniref:Reverse transcriptase domain-containing protein n=1 Tax=Mugilogobius chulae TaxID=88201 RepID=A0AAW0NAN2_9GOBI